MAASCLLSANLKFNGVLTVQAKGNGPVPLIMAECSRNHHLRAIARFANPDTPIPTELQTSSEDDLQQLVGEGHLAITVQPDRGERYQGLVPLAHAGLAQSLTEYFKHSQQLDTRIWLSANEHGANGLLLQTLPCQLQTIEERHRNWEHLCHLADTLSPEEQLSLHHGEQLHRLFHQDSVRLFAETPRIFACSCSKTRIGQAIICLGWEEATSILEEQGQIETRCEFCQHSYRFSAEDISALFGGKEHIIH